MSPDTAGLLFGMLIIFLGLNGIKNELMRIRYSIEEYVLLQVDKSPMNNTDLKALIDVGDKIEAIKLYRKLTNCSLKYANDQVEKLMAERDYDDEGKN